MRSSQFRSEILSAALALSIALHSGDARSTENLPDCSDVKLGDSYFPDGSLDPFDQSSHEFRRSWYTMQLRAMAEPTLACTRPEGEESYRFLWLRTFHNPAAFRIVIDESGATLTFVRLDGGGGYEPGKVAEQLERKLTPSEQDEFSRALHKASFWSLPTTPWIKRLGFDGAQWILEGSRAGEHHVVDRWSPLLPRDSSYASQFVRLCLLMMKLAGYQPKEIY